jgi:hypothetical protein
MTRRLIETGMWWCANGSGVGGVLGSFVTASRFLSLITNYHRLCLRLRLPQPPQMTSSTLPVSLSQASIAF